MRGKINNDERQEAGQQAEGGATSVAWDNDLRRSLEQVTATADSCWKGMLSEGQFRVCLLGCLCKQAGRTFEMR